MSRRWSEDQTVQFVRLYRELEPLWNVSHPDYKKRRIRIACVEKIIEEMNIPEFCTKDAINKIKSLRSTYCQEVNKINKSINEDEADQIYQPALKWFPDMDFVMKNCGTLRAKAAINNMEFDLIYQQEDEIETPIEIEISESPHQLENTNPKENGILREEKPHRIGRRNLNKTKSFHRGIGCTSFTVNKISEAVCELANVSKTLRANLLQDVKVEDECDIVGRHVALQLRELPPATRLQAQMEIQKILFNHRLGNMETYQTTTYSNG